MTEKEKMLLGKLYNANYDEKLRNERQNAKSLCYEFIGPNCSFYTDGHSLNAILRNQWVEFAKLIEIGNNVCIGGSVTILPDVKIGDNVVIGTGSVVNKDIPSNTVAVGNPCKVIKNIEKLN